MSPWYESAIRLPIEFYEMLLYYLPSASIFTYTLLDTCQLLRIVCRSEKAISDYNKGLLDWKEVDSRLKNNPRCTGLLFSSLAKRIYRNYFKE